ncbi:MAG TPA: cytochrome c biogenesis protein CcdA [Steroidobacteraceae bacterium]|jgi:cytochrome c biogenesis protein CcdA/thiol-disulfide isomerase/thioredoxin|nr:cytochrome c biogenesis protein CcdA [Steroidobacteraceae bacterium]
MILFVLAYVGGVLTIVSPCILPVLPFVFARADRPFLRNGLPLLIGMAATFAAVATLAAVAGGWAVKANEYGRDVALALVALFGVALLVPSLAEWLTRPLVALGGRLSQSADREGAGSILPSVLLGVATGLLWAPCAGPILGLILTAAALQGASVQTSLLLLAYALGAATSLAVALLVGGGAFAALKRSLGASEWIRRALGVAVLLAVGVIALGLDTGYLTNLSTASTTSLEQRLLARLRPAGPSLRAGGARGPAMSAGAMVMKGAGGAAAGAMSADVAAMNAAAAATAMSPNPAMSMRAAGSAASGTQLPVEGNLPSLAGAVQWLNSAPLTAQALRGKVVLVDFWTYSCINCLRTIPYVRAWAQKYRDHGLVVIGVHTPEFAFEKNVTNVKSAVARLKIAYPVAIDSNYAIWRAFDNDAWPADYFVDAQGRVRDHHFGEGDYAGAEHVIQALLLQAGNRDVPIGLVDVSGSGAEAAPDIQDIQSPETYIGYERAANFVSPGGAVNNTARDYQPGMPRLNEWGLSGSWTVEAQRAVLGSAGGAIVFRFHSRDLHLVLGPAADGRPVRFRVTIDGAAPGPDHGADTDADGNGVVTGQRLYQLIRQRGTIGDRTFEVRFLDPGVQAYSFTFG